MLSFGSKRCLSGIGIGYWYMVIGIYIIKEYIGK